MKLSKIFDSVGVEEYVRYLPPVADWDFKTVDYNRVYVSVIDIKTFFNSAGTLLCICALALVASGGANARRLWPDGNLAVLYAFDVGLFCLFALVCLYCLFGSSEIPLDPSIGVAVYFLCLYLTNTQLTYALVFVILFSTRFVLYTFYIVRARVKTRSTRPRRSTA